MQILLPPSWPKPKGYSNGIAASGRLVFIAGQIGWNEECRFETNSFVGQFGQAMRNVMAICAEAGAGPEHIVRLTWFITDKAAYLANLVEIGQLYRDVMGRNYPVMSVVEVKALMEDQALIEIEATAVVPEATPVAAR